VTWLVYCLLEIDFNFNKKAVFWLFCFVIFMGFRFCYFFGCYGESAESGESAENEENGESAENLFQCNV
jgi:hypothetical protein